MAIVTKPALAGAKPQVALALLLALAFAALALLAGRSAQAFAAEPQVQPALTTQATPLKAQSEYVYITSPEKSDTLVVGEPVTVKAYAGLYLFLYGQAVPNIISFKVTCNGAKVHYACGRYDSSGETVETTFTPKKAGTYKIEIAGPSFSEADYGDFSATDTVTVKVKDIASVVKASKPDGGDCGWNRYKKNRVKFTLKSPYSGVKVYRSTARNGKYKLVKTVAVKSPSKSKSFTDKVDAKTNYYYKIRYYYKSGSKVTLGKFSDVAYSPVKATATKPTITKAAKVKAGIKLAWKMKGDCHACLIYRAAKKNGKYELIDGTEGNKRSFTDKTAVSGKTYWYKVEAKTWLDWKGDKGGVYKKSAPVKAKA